MVNCCVVGCVARSGRERNRPFYRIPVIIKHGTPEINELSQRRRAAWLSAIKRADFTELKAKYERVCAIHFVSGKPSALEDYTNPDWKPSQRMGYATMPVESLQAKLDEREWATRRHSPDTILVSSIANQISSDVSAGDPLANAENCNKKYEVSAQLPLKHQSSKIGMAFPDSPLKCCVPGCPTTTKLSTNACKLFKYPSEELGALRNVWLMTLRYKARLGSSWEPTNDTYVCSNHFPFGAAINCGGSANFVPTLFPTANRKRTAESPTVLNKLPKTVPSSADELRPSVGPIRAVPSKKKPRRRPNCCVEGCKGMRTFNYYGFPRVGAEQVRWWRENGKQDVVDLRAAWVISLKLDPETVTDHSYVCSAHFSDKNYIDPELKKKEPILKTFAVPDIHLPPYKNKRLLRAKAKAVIEYYEKNIREQQPGSLNSTRISKLAVKPNVKDASTQTYCNNKTCKLTFKEKNEETQSQPTRWIRPPLSMKILVILAMINGPQRGLVVSEITFFLRMYFPHFKGIGQLDNDVQSTLLIETKVFQSDSCSKPSWSLREGIISRVRTNIERHLTNFLPSARASMPFPDKAGPMFRGELMWDGQLNLLLVTQTPSHVVPIDLDQYQNELMSIKGNLPVGTEQIVSQSQQTDVRIGTTAVENVVLACNDSSSGSQITGSLPADMPNYAMSSSSFKKQYHAPPISYQMLITLAIINSPGKKVSTQGIFAFIREMFPYYKYNYLKGWESTVRQKLSNLKMFEKEPAPASTKKNAYVWRLNPANATDFTHELDMLKNSSDDICKKLLNSMSCPGKVEAILRGELTLTWYRSEENEKLGCNQNETKVQYSSSQDSDEEYETETIVLDDSSGDGSDGVTCGKEGNFVDNDPTTLANTGADLNSPTAGETITVPCRKESDPAGTDTGSGAIPELDITGDSTGTETQDSLSMPRTGDSTGTETQDSLSMPRAGDSTGTETQDSLSMPSLEETNMESALPKPDIGSQLAGGTMDSFSPMEVTESSSQEQPISPQSFHQPDQTGTTVDSSQVIESTSHQPVLSQSSKSAFPEPDAMEVTESTSLERSVSSFPEPDGMEVTESTSHEQSVSSFPEPDQTEGTIDSLQVIDSTSQQKPVLSQSSESAFPEPYRGETTIGSFNRMVGIGSTSKDHTEATVDSLEVIESESQEEQPILPQTLESPPLEPKLVSSQEAASESFTSHSLESSPVHSAADAGNEFDLVAKNMAILHESEPDLAQASKSTKSCPPNATDASTACAELVTTVEDSELGPFYLEDDEDHHDSADTDFSVGEVSNGPVPSPVSDHLPDQLIQLLHAEEAQSQLTHSPC